MPTREYYLDKFYECMQRLEAILKNKKTFKDWPEWADKLKKNKMKGVYFIFDPQESFHGNELVVRVGSHSVVEGQHTILYSRLRQHRGNNNGGGNHSDPVPFFTPRVS